MVRETTRTSRMVAITGPSRWGLERVAVFFSKVIPLKSQVVVVRGDCVRDQQTGNLYTFHWREGDSLKLSDYYKGTPSKRLPSNWWDSGS